MWGEVGYMQFTTLLNMSQIRRHLERENDVFSVKSYQKHDEIGHSAGNV